MTRRAAASRRPRAAQRTVGLVVEGDAEFTALPLLHKRRLIPGCPPLKPINVHGIGGDTTPQGIARLIVPKVVEHQVAGRTEVVVCLDRESRDVCAPGLAAAVFDALVGELGNRKRPTAGLQVIVADRSFEAWILADALGLHEREVFKQRPAFHSFEGQLGQRQRKGLVEMEKLLGRPYSKAVDGPRLFASVRFPEARQHRAGGRGSRSLDKFLRALGV